MYTYAGSRAKTLENELLSENQMELLLSAKRLVEDQRILNETFVGPYIARSSTHDIPYILETVVTDAKDTLVSIAPEPELLSILWLKYDFYNLAAIIKGASKGLSSEEIESYCFSAGVYTPQYLIEKYHDNDLFRLNPFLGSGARDATTYTEVSDIDRVMNISYFKAINSIAQESGDHFLVLYVSLLIDFFNIQANLRALGHGSPKDAPKAIRIQGGTLPRSALENEGALLDALHTLGPKEQWEEALEEYRQTGSYALIETAFDNYIASFVKDSSHSIFTIASLFSYFQAVKNNVQIIRTILVGKHTGLSEYEIRKTIRKRYG